MPSCNSSGVHNKFSGVKLGSVTENSFIPMKTELGPKKSSIERELVRKPHVTTSPLLK